MAIQDQEEREVERLRLDIVENILTLRCPRFKIAFIDYSGCAALTCGCCKAAFCAVCLKDCGSNAHLHVRICDQNAKKDLYITLQEFNKHHSKRREDLINEKIKNVAPKVKTLLLKKMSKDLNDLGINIKILEADKEQNDEPEAAAEKTEPKLQPIRRPNENLQLNR